MGPQPFGCGRRMAAATRTAVTMASMGPQPFGCGRELPAAQRTLKGAALQWGRNLSVAEGARNQCGLCHAPDASMGPQPFGCGRCRAPARVIAAPGFNGAATFRLRKAAGKSGNLQALDALQWGRNLSVAEGCHDVRLTSLPRWLQWGRNLSVAEGRRPASHLEGLGSFNGAATFRLRKDVARIDQVG